MTIAKHWPLLLALLAGTAGALPAAGRAAETGSVAGTIRLEKAKVVYDGPKSSRYLVVSLEGPGLDAEPAADRTETMDQKGLVFIPHVLALRQGQSVKFLNSDTDNHNVYFLHDETGETLDIGTWGPGTSVTHRFDEPGMFITLCTLHLEMAAYILVFPHPYFQVVELDEETGQAGYQLSGVPPGQYELRVWHKNLKQKKGPKTIQVTGGETTVLDDVVTKKKYAK